MSAMQRAIKLLKNYFTTWWIPLSVNLVVMVIFVTGSFFERNWIMDLGLLIFYVNILGTLVSSVVQIVRRKWYFTIPQIGISALLFFYVTTIFTMSPPDYYGVHKELPEHIHFDEPLDQKPTQDQLNASDLVLAHSGQPGIYSYYTNYAPAESGHFYIKAFEITSNDRLSEDRITERSKSGVGNDIAGPYEGRFTIYEGSWGDPYGSRIELWFQPSSGKEAYKITERNYIVEGWMR